jgi:hypothetical protein|tara:strand:- start:8 stop:304 length:297 start_codon:yes stop_codon:yes gene_type:complete
MKSAKHRNTVVILVLLLVVISSGVWMVRRFASRDIDHVILISIDTCRADHLSCYGCSRTTTPHIDAVAKDGFLFANAISPVPLTLPAWRPPLKLVQEK